MQLHFPTLPSSSSSSGTAHTDTSAANSSSSTTTPPTEEDDNDSLFGEGDNDSLFGEGDFPDQDILAGSGTSFEAEAENELTLVNVSRNIPSTYLQHPKLTLSQTAVAPRMRIALPPVLAGMAQEETVAGSSSSNEMLEEELFDLDALLRDVGVS